MWLIHEKRNLPPQMLLEILTLCNIVIPLKQCCLIYASWVKWLVVGALSCCHGENYIASHTENTLICYTGGCWSCSASTSNSQHITCLFKQDVTTWCSVKQSKLFYFIFIFTTPPSLIKSLKSQVLFTSLFFLKKTLSRNIYWEYWC